MKPKMYTKEALAALFKAPNRTAQ